MTDALRFEWTRIRTLRSTYWLTGLALLLSALVAGIVAWVMRGDTIGVGEGGIILTGGSAFSPLPFTAVFMGILGAFAFGHEYRHGTILATLAAVPRRGALAFAKCLVIAIWSLVVAAASVSLNWVVAWALAGESLALVDGAAGRALLGYLCYVVLWGLLGLGLASLLRNMPATLVILLVFPLVVEPVVSSLALLDAMAPVREYVHYLPFTAGNAMSQSVATPEFAGGGENPMFGEQPTRLVSGLTFTGWVALVILPALALFHKRDA
jgi:ABC-2 type transport system permease protein